MPDDHHFKFKDITKFYFIYILISAGLVLFSRSSFFLEVSYGLFSNCFDLVLTLNGEPCFEYFMAKNLQESKNIPFFFQNRHLFIMYIIRQAIFHTYVTTMMIFIILSKKIHMVMIDDIQGNC